MTIPDTIRVVFLLHRDALFTVVRDPDGEDKTWIPVGPTRIGSILINTKEHLGCSEEALEFLSKVRRGRDAIGDVDWFECYADGQTQGPCTEAAFSWFGNIHRVFYLESAEASRNHRARRSQCTVVPNEPPAQDGWPDPETVMAQVNDAIDLQETTYGYSRWYPSAPREEQPEVAEPDLADYILGTMGLMAPMVGSELENKFRTQISELLQKEMERMRISVELMKKHLKEANSEDIDRILGAERNTPFSLETLCIMAAYLGRKPRLVLEKFTGENSCP